MTGTELTATEEAMAEAYRINKGRKKILRWLCFIAAIILIFWALSPFGQFAINGVKSLDGFLYFVEKGAKPVHGEIAAFYPPNGNLYPDEMWFGKIIAGSAGDVVTIENRSFYINGHYIGDAKESSTGGIPLEMSSPGVIPVGYYFMWTPHEGSYDSRYEDINWIHETRIFGRMHRIF